MAPLYYPLSLTDHAHHQSPETNSSISEVRNSICVVPGDFSERCWDKYRSVVQSTTLGAAESVFSVFKCLMKI